MISFVDKQISNVHDTQRSFLLLKRIEKLQLPNLSISDRYAKILSFYDLDVDRVIKLYNKTKEDPQLSHNMPPIAGRILWSRQLYRRIQHPMSVFEANKIILEHVDAKKIIKKYNQISAVLIEYELLHHKTWMMQTKLVLTGVHSSLLVKDGDEDYLVNFDPEIITLIRESECMKRIGGGLLVPDEVDQLVSRKDQFKSNYDLVKMCMDKFSSLKGSIKPSFKELLTERMKHLDRTISPGLTSLTWTSPGICDYCDTLSKAFDEFEVVLSRANDLATYRIDAVLNEIHRIKLCELDRDEPVTIEDFYRETDLSCMSGATQLHTKSINIESATVELILILYPEYLEHSHLIDRQKDQEYLDTVESAKLPKQDEKAFSTFQKKQRELMQQYARDFLYESYNRCSDAVIRLFKQTLDDIRRRITTCSEILGSLKPQKAGPNFEDLTEFAAKSPSHRPFLKCFAVLELPDITMQPKFDEIQRTFTKTVKAIINVSKRVPIWESIKNENLKITYSIFHDSSYEKDLSSDSFLQSKLSFSNSLSSLSYAGDEEDTFYSIVKSNKDILSLGSVLASSFQIKDQVVKIIERVNDYKYIWQKRRDHDVNAFLASQPVVSDFAVVLDDFEFKVEALNQLPVYVPIGMIALYTERAKQNIAHEVGLWKLAFGRACQAIHKANMEELSTFISERSVRLSREITDLDQIRIAMKVLGEIRDRQLEFDSCIQPIEDCYTLLQKHGIQVPAEELELSFTIRYNWTKLIEQANESLNILLQVQPVYRNNLEAEVREFSKQCNKFLISYRNEGPLILGLSPREASDRLFLFKSTFDALYKKFETCTGGQRLFGMPVITLPELEEIK